MKKDKKALPMYEERIVLLLDILGFREMIESSAEKTEEIDKIKKAILTIREVFDIAQTTHERTITQFSDSIVVSFLISEKGEVAFLLSKTHKLIKTLIAQEIMCRGAITKGNMIHDENFMFGPAFIEAYSLEIKVANYPRIILIDESIIEIGVEYHGYHPADDPSYEKSEINSFITKDFDGFYFVDYFNVETIWEISDVDKQYVKDLRSLIIEGLKKHKDQPDIIQKYEWMRSKYNNLVINLKEDNRVEVAGFTLGSNKTDLFYQGLTQI